ncbi:MAG TPA: hypothetical protein VJQ56_10695 [Blastocatellia bacterium]|nr:hypothetical protein [Blastocatellia bacterium]
MIFRKIIATVLLASSLTAMLTGTPIVSIAQSKSEDSFAARYPQLSEAVSRGKFPRALFESAAQFEREYPRLVSAFKREKIDYNLFRTAFRGVQKKEIGVTKLVQALQSGRIKLKEFRDELSVFQTNLHPQSAGCSEAPCDDRTTVYYLGCKRGGGDMLLCFLLAEQMMCICLNAMCGYGNDCGVIDI